MGEKAEKCGHPIPFFWNIFLHQFAVRCLLFPPVSIHRTTKNILKCQWRTNSSLFLLLVTDKLFLPCCIAIRILVSLPSFSAGPCEQRLYLSPFCTPNTNPSSLNVTEASEQLVCGLDCVSLHHAHFFSLGCHCINTMPMKWTVSIHLVRTIEYSAAGRELEAENTKTNFTVSPHERESRLWFLEEVIPAKRKKRKRRV